MKSVRYKDALLGQFDSAFDNVVDFQKNLKQAFFN